MPHQKETILQMNPPKSTFLELVSHPSILKLTSPVDPSQFNQTLKKARKNTDAINVSSLT